MSTPTTLPTDASTTEAADDRSLWLLAYATACAEAVASGLELLDDDEVAVDTRGDGPGFELRVDADPPRRWRALRWSAGGGWSATRDAGHRRARRWVSLPLGPDADPLLVREVLRTRR